MLKVHDSGVDWLTLSFPAGGRDLDRAMWRMENTLRDLSRGGQDLKRQNWQGYSGYACYGLFSGIREDGLIIRASSQEAKLAEKICREEAWDARCTRLDLQITADVGDGQDDFGERVQKTIEAATSQISAAKQPKIASYKIRGAGAGCTVGSRSSERYSRFYNKTLEQRNKVAPNLWRYEVEFKGQQARLMYKMLMQAVDGRWLALSVVKTTFEIYGVDMSFVGASEPCELPSSYRQNDDERRLAWLKSHVRRTVLELKSRGFESEVREALDLH